MRPNVVGKAEAYRVAREKAAAFVAAKDKCRKLIDLTIEKKPEDATLLARAMIEVGAAANRYLGDPTKTAFFLGYLSRRIRAGDSIDC